MKISSVDLHGKKKSDIEVSSYVFDVKFRDDVIQRYIRVYLNNTRKCSAKTKDRSEVRGGGRKPWSQKGTGRARHGSRRSPIWVGGGVAHGPIGIKTFLKMNKKEKNLFFRVVMSRYLKRGDLIVICQKDVEKLALGITKKSKGITKKIDKSFKNLSKSLNYVIINIASRDFSKSLRNNKRFRYSEVDNIDWFNLMKSDRILISENSLNEINTKLARYDKND